MGFADSPTSFVQIADVCWSPLFDHLPASQLQSHQTDEGTSCPESTGDCLGSSPHLEACELQWFF